MRIQNLLYLVFILFVLSLLCYLSEPKYLDAKNESFEEEIPINGVWTIHDKMKDFSRLLGLRRVPYYGTFCIDIKPHENKAKIYFYTEEKPFEITIKKISINEYEFIYKNKKLGFIVWQRVDETSSDPGFASIRHIRMGIKEWNNILSYDSHGQLGCLWENVELAKCNFNEVELCLKDAKASDEYFKNEKALSADLK